MSCSWPVGATVAGIEDSRPASILAHPRPWFDDAAAHVGKPARQQSPPSQRIWTMVTLHIWDPAQRRNYLLLNGALQHIKVSSLADRRNERTVSRYRLDDAVSKSTAS